MKGLTVASLRRSVICAVLVALAATTAPAAVLMNMTFNNGGADIPETGWNGTTAPGGSLATGLTVATLMQISGDFTSQNQPNVFHVDNWHTTNNMTTTYVTLGLGTQVGYSFDLTGAGASFSTRLHQHPTAAAPDMFNQVELRINGTSFGNQPYTPAGGAQTLSWDLSGSGLSNLTSADFRLYFTGTVNPGNNNHGPEWSLTDGAFVQVNGTLVPEPSTTAMLAIGAVGAGVFVFRSRRRS